MSVGKFMQTAANRDYSKSWQAPGSFPWIAQQPKEPITGRAHSVRENYIRCVKGEQPYWMPAYFYESNTVWPDAMEERNQGHQGFCQLERGSGMAGFISGGF